MSITSSGSLAYTLRFQSVPGRGPEPQLGLAYDSEGGSGVVGAGFSLTGAGSAIERCPHDRNQDGEIRDVRFDKSDKLCLDKLRLIPVREAPGIIEYRTAPDTHVKVIGHYPADAEEKTPDNALFFEAHGPTGLVTEYGGAVGGRPLAPGGVPRAFLATKTRDGRGNAMTYAYCFAGAEEYTAEVALTEIRYSSFEGTPPLEPSRAVRFLYGTRDPADIRVRYVRGMALQSSLRLEEIQMLGPEDALVRRYGFTYEQGPATKRTLLASVEECGGDGSCKPPTRFHYKSDTPGFKRITTSISAPTSKLASPLLMDIDADGLEDLVVPDTNPALSTPQNPITEWLVAKNFGEGASPPYFAAPELAFSQEWAAPADPSGPSDPSLLQPELGTATDYDQNGAADVLLHDVHGDSVNEMVLLAQPDRTFKLHDTGVRRPFPLHRPPAPPALSSLGGSVHRIDLDGDDVPDRLSCEDHGAEVTGVPGEPVWKAHLWRPAKEGAPAGFDPEGELIEALVANGCGEHMHTVDLNADGKTEILVTSKLSFEGTKEVDAFTYSALSRRSDGSFEVWDTKLPVQRSGGRVVFVDINGDRKPDAVHSGSPDGRLRTYMNQDSTFTTAYVESLEGDGIGEQDAFIHLAVQLDYNADGRVDLLMPIAGGVWPNTESALPHWYVLQATGAQGGPTFTPVDAEIPFEAELGDAMTLADPRGPRVGDVSGDGAADVVLLLDGVFNVFQSLAADQDVLVSISDGMNDHDPGEPGFVPSVSVAYGHLIDPWITNGAKPSDPDLSKYLYRSRVDAANGCSYPRHCVVGPRRVVREYALNDGEGGQRRFSVRYEDGRYHRHVGSLGFAKRIITDRDTGAGVADGYDNLTSFEVGSGEVFPFAGQATKQRRWHPGLPTQPNPAQIDLVFLEAAPTFVPTNDGATYFALATTRRARHLQGVYPSPQSPAQSIEAYVAEVESKGGAALLSDTTTKVLDFDEFGNAREIDVKTSGVDLTLHIERTFKNDVERWVLGQMETQRECSSASGMSRCRTLTRTTTRHGEVHTETIETDDEGQETKLSVVLERDDFGNVTEMIADDEFGHHRTFHADYDPQGIFPVSHTNAAGHTSLVDYDPGLGLLVKQVDPNELVTKWGYDSHGRLEHLERPDGSTTSITLARSRDGGPGKDAWRVTERTTTSGGADDLVAFDGLGRPVRLWFHGPDTPEEAGSPPRLMQVIAYDRLSGGVARRSVPVSEMTPEEELLFDAYEYDAVGREVRHTTPWNATTITNYKGSTVEVTDPLLNVTITENDALGRPVIITDAKKGTTNYTYGPFDTLYTVTAPDSSLTRMTRDALGRVWKLEDPDRGTTILVHDGYGELVSSTDALGRTVTFGYDDLGRTESRTDQKGAEVLTTTWTWDTAPNGIGKLHKLTSPDGENEVAYNARG
jgi:YD repeat-containing protein